MKITIFTLGTRGDTEPYLALAAGLHKAGHRVTLVAPQRYAELIRAQGVNARPMRLDVQELFEKPPTDAILKGATRCAYSARSAKSSRPSPKPHWTTTGRRRRTPISSFRPASHMAASKSPASATFR